MLGECAECIPHTPNAVRKLLKYGLARTKQYEGAPDTDPDAVRAWDYRLRYLRYLDRLRTFCLICDRANVDFNPDDYAHFRDADLLETAKVFAGAMRFEAVDALFTHHGAATLPHRTAILEAIPETCPPCRYAALLPAAADAASTYVLGWEQEAWRTRDWVERDGEGDVAGLYEGPEMSVDEASAWYRARAIECDARAGQVDAVLSLIDFGIANNIPGLRDMQGSLQTLGVLVYDAGCADPHLSLVQYMPLPVVARFQMLLANCGTDGEFLTRMGRYGAKFLALATGADDKDAVAILGAVLVHLAEARHMARVRIVLQNHATMFPTRRFPESMKAPGHCTLSYFVKARGAFYSVLSVTASSLVPIAVECVMTCTDTTQLAEQQQIVEWLNAQQYALQAGDPLRATIMQVRARVAASAALAQHNIHRAARVFNKCDAEEALSIVKTLCTHGLTARPPYSRREWRALLDLVHELHAKVLCYVSLHDCHALYVAAVLASRDPDTIDLARELIAARGMADSQYLQAEEAEPLALHAAQEYFNAAGSPTDPALRLARACLLAVRSSPAVRAEQRLLDVVQLLGRMHVAILPVQVRLAATPADIIAKAMPAAYNKVDDMLRLADLLDMGPGAHQAVLAHIAEYALGLDEADTAQAVALRLAGMRTGAGWQACYAVAVHPSTTGPEDRHRLIAYALAHCDKIALASIVKVCACVSINCVGIALIHHCPCTYVCIDVPANGERTGCPVDCAHGDARGYHHPMAAWRRCVSSLLHA